MYEDNESQHPQAFFVMQQQHQQREMQAWHEVQMMEIKTSMDNFMDGLTAEQCLGLSRMVQLFTNNPHYLNIVIGQLSIMLRLVHKVCASCGDTGHSTVEHITAQQPVPENDYSWLQGLSPDDQAARLNVTEHNELVGQMICYTCQTQYKTLFERASHGQYCPVCLSRELITANNPDSVLSTEELMFRYRVSESHSVEDGCFCFNCFTEFPTLKHRIEQGRDCPVCKIQSEVGRDESTS